MLTMVLPPRASARGTYRGDQQHSFVLFDASDGDPPRQLKIVVSEMDEEHWRLSVTTVPPAQGILLLTAGIKSFTASFTAEGVATISSIPAQLVIHPEAPDLELALLPLAAQSEAS
jgi:hypothetical protein